MDTNSEAQLKLDPEVMVNKDEKQETTSLDKKYGVSLFQDKDTNYSLYQYDGVNKQIYNDEAGYKLDIATNQFASLYTEPAVYSVDTSMSTADYTKVLYIILIAQVLIVGYFVRKIVKVRGKL